MPSNNKAPMLGAILGSGSEEEIDEEDGIVTATSSSTGSDSEDDTNDNDCSNVTKEDLASSIEFLRQKQELLGRVSWLLDAATTQDGGPSRANTSKTSDPSFMMVDESGYEEEREEEDDDEEDDDEDEETLEVSELDCLLRRPVTACTDDEDWEDEEEIYNKEKEKSLEVEEGEANVDDNEDDEDKDEEEDERGLENLLQAPEEGSIWDKAKQYLNQINYPRVSCTPANPEAALQILFRKQDVMATSKNAIPQPPSKKRRLVDMRFVHRTTANKFDNQEKQEGNSLPTHKGNLEQGDNKEVCNLALQVSATQKQIPDQIVSSMNGERSPPLVLHALPQGASCFQPLSLSRKFSDGMPELEASNYLSESHKDQATLQQAMTFTNKPL